MKYLISALMFIGLLLSCATTQNTLDSSDVVLNPQVKKWMETVSANSAETISVTINSTESVDDYQFLRKINDTYYTGRLSVEQIKTLLKDSRIKRISSETSRLH